MKAIVHSEYGPPDVLRYEEVAKPVPREDEVLIRVRAASVNPLDWHFVRGTPYLVRIMTGVGKPKTGRLGVDVAGEVEAVGARVTRIQPGDAVFGPCRGAFAEYACASESALVTKPGSITFEEAASVNVAGITALQALRDKGHVQRGQKVLINGAGGGVGTFAVQIARSFGAEVTGVCSTANVDLVRSIGADHVIDYTREDFTTGGQRYDVIVDSAGNHSLPALRRAMSPRGIYVAVGGPDGGHWIGPIAHLLRARTYSLFVSQRIVMILAKGSLADLTILRDLIAAGTIKPVIGRRYPLRETADAIRYVETGHARGKVIITFD